MVREIAALVVSAGEPQKERCLAAVRNQTVPFVNIIHMDNIIPESVAFNSGMAQVKCDWVMKIDGDVILRKDAVEFALDSMCFDKDVYCNAYTLFDTFMNKLLFGCGILNSALYKQVRYPNMLTNDNWAGKKLKRMGYRRIAPFDGEVPIGTHCDSPDEFQIFRVFFTRGVKGNKKFIWESIVTQYELTGDSRYKMAMQAVEFGEQIKKYPCSHNLEYDRKMYEEFNANCRRDC